MGEAVDHLKVYHKVAEYKQKLQDGSRIVSLNWLPGRWIELGEKLDCVPALATFDEGTVLLNASSRSHSWEFWVTHLGGEKQAQKYEVKMVSSHKDLPSNITFQGKVYGSDTSKAEIYRDKGKWGDGVLELSKGLMKKLGKMGQERFEVPMTYQLVRK